MPGDHVPQRTDTTGQVPPVVGRRAERPLRVLAAALLALSFASSPAPARAASVLSDGSVTPQSGTTATAFTFSVHYTSTDSPTRPAQAVWAQVGGVTVTLIKVSGSAHDGTWQGTATLPAGTWQVIFHATTSGDPQPEPLPAPIITVQEAPAATPSPTSPPTATDTPLPPAPPPPTNPPPAPAPVPQPPPPTTEDEDPIRTQRSSPLPTPGVSGSARAGTPVPTPTRAANEDDDLAGTSAPSNPSNPSDAADDAGTSPGSRLASLLIIGGSMSLIGAAVLSRQWFVARRARSH